MLSQSLEKVASPRGLQRVTFGCNFDQISEKVALPSGLHNLTFGLMVNHSAEKVALPSSLQSLTFCREFHRAWRTWLCHAVCRA